MECREDLLEEARELIVSALKSYMLSNCRRTVSIAKLTEQKRIRMEFHGLFKHYTPSENFPRFMDVLRYVLTCVGLDEVKRLLRAQEVVPDEAYAIYSYDEYAKLCNEVCEEASAS